MGKNLVREVLEGSSTWVCPAGVTKIYCSAYEAVSTVMAGGDFSYVNGYGNFGTYLSYSFGANGSGQLGNNSITSASNPVALSNIGASGINIPRVMALGSTHAMFLFQAGQISVFGTGSNSNGQLGDSSVTPRSAPGILNPFSSTSIRFKTFAAGTDSSYGIAHNGDVYSWGLNSVGQLASNNTSSRSSPAAIVGSLKFKRIAAGVSHCLGLTTGGDLYAWGQNTSGQCGDNTIVPKSSPVLVSGGHKFVSISAGNAQSYGIKADGTAYAWGANTNGALGTNDTTSRSTPTLIVGGLQWRQFSNSFGDWQAGITKTGAAYAWGTGTSGQLGDGTAVSKSSPVAVTGGLNFSEIRGGNNHAIALVGGMVYTWGLGTSGQLGDNTATSKSSPVQILSTSSGTNLMIPPPNPRKLMNRVMLDVVPGLSYPVDTLAYACTVGGFVIGSGIAADVQLELEYFA